ncbi:hypothetical protein [Paracoccus albus]|uniref:hypothetical protein n=1 Tax=Paracoccus albus TaxID=3017784 RepID=UPI0022F0E406|nr:hypothetical protein [Paracoccus albus]WBU61445.1 hypothetical protein PAF20_05975 [Paracoccus albus]
MSVWLSTANSIAGASRGQMMAEMHKAQNQMIRDWQNAWFDIWLGMWFPMGGGRK